MTFQVASSKIQKLEVDCSQRWQDRKRQAGQRSTHQTTKTSSSALYVAKVTESKLFVFCREPRPVLLTNTVNR